MSSVPKVRPPLPVPSEPQPVYHKLLSYDAMIGIFGALMIFAATGYNLTFAMWIAGICVTVWLWHLLHRVAPVTARVILAIFLFFVLVLASIMNGGRYYGGGYYGRRRRWW